MYKEVWQEIEKSKKLVILSHINPDIDAIGTSLALYNILKNQKSVSVVNFTKELPREADFLAGFEKIKHEMPRNYDLVVSFDCGSFERLGFEISSKIINIDHHVINEMYGKLNLIECNFASSSMVLYKLLKLNGIKISKDVAECIYSALVSDCGFFKFKATNQDVFEVAKELVKLGANPHYIANKLTRRVSLAKFRLTQFVLDTLELHLNGRVSTIFATQQMFRKSGALRIECEGISSIPTTLATVEVSLFLIEEVNGDVKISLRSKTDVDVSKIAFHFGGGGHTNSSGAIFKNSNIATVKKTILEYLKEVMI